MDNLHGVITLFLVIAAGGVIGGFGALYWLEPRVYIGYKTWSPDRLNWS